MGTNDPHGDLQAAVVEAVLLFEQLEYAKATEVLWPHLRDVDPATAPPDEVLQVAAFTYAQCADNNRNQGRGLRWALYGLLTAIRLEGADGEMPRVAAGVLACVLQEIGSPTIAVPLWELIAASYQRAGRPAQHVDAVLSLAEALHETGACGTAVQQATAALSLYPAPAGELTDGAVSDLVRVLSLLELCGRNAEALALIEQWQPRLPTTDQGRAHALEVASRLGLFLLADDHQWVCAARLDDRHGLDDSRPRICRVHTPLRRNQVRQAFLHALTGESAEDTAAQGTTPCTCTPPPPPSGWRRLTPASVVDALTVFLIVRLTRRAKKRLAAGPRAGTSASTPPHAAGPNRSPIT